MLRPKGTKLSDAGPALVADGTLKSKGLVSIATKLQRQARLWNDGPQPHILQTARVCVCLCVCVCVCVCVQTTCACVR